MTVELVKTALLNKWEIADVGKDNMINKHIKEITPIQMEAIMLDFLRSKCTEMPRGFKLDLENGYKLNVVSLEHIGE